MPEYRLPGEIERRSMEIISRELTERNLMPVPENLAVVLRVIHATADFDYASSLCFTAGAVEKAVHSLGNGVPIVTDTNMAGAGISRVGLKRLGSETACFMAEESIAVLAKRLGTTRAYAAMKVASERFPGAVYAVGNAPTALISLTELIENGLRPALVIGVPVGFVNVVESKETLFSACERADVPAIIARGRKGGSSVAAAICNALLYTAAGMLDPSDRGWN